MEKMIIVATFLLIVLYGVFGMDLVYFVGDIAKHLAMFVFVVWSFAFTVLGFYMVYIEFKGAIYKAYDRMSRKSDEFFWKS